jgi:hypothetical protein
MKLYTHTFLNPYFIKIKDKEYKINSITVFDETGKLAYNSQGWFNGVKEIEFDVDCVLKRKVDYKSTVAFIIGRATPHGETLYGLYIPNSVIGLTPPTYDKVYEGKAIRETIKSSIYNNVLFETYHFINKEVSEIETKIIAIGRAISITGAYEYNKLSEYVAELSVLNNELKEATNRMNRLTIEEFLATKKSDGGI